MLKMRTAELIGPALDAYWEHTGESVEMRDRVHDRARKLYAAMARAAEAEKTKKKKSSGLTLYGVE